MNVSLKRFLQSGSLGQLHLGMSMQDVLELLGPPERGSATPHDEDDRLWMYGNLSVSFEDPSSSSQGVWCIDWHPSEIGPPLPVSCVVEDWDIAPEMTSTDVKAYLQANGLTFRYRNTKGYFERKSVAEWMSPELAEAARLGFLTFKKPKNEADIVSVTVFTAFSLASGVVINFNNERLVSLLIHSAPR